MNAPSQLRLLLVEDEPTQLMLIKRLLQKAGYSVVTADNGEEALTRISTGQFQFLVTDWDMPGMDGATLCRRVREAELPGYLYVLLLTGHSSTENVVAGLQAGADDYIRKPANESELLARLSAGQRIIRLEQSLRDANAKIQHLSITDPLVGTYNRRYLNEQLVKDIERARRYGHPLSAIMTDLDHFKSVNDLHGHLVGDEVLRKFVDLARNSIRQASDWMARYGGEEFVIVLPETPLEGATATAEKIRAQCTGTEMGTSAGSLTITASFGVAALSRADEEAVNAADSLLRRADAALYAGKREGRNRVVVAES